MHSHDHCCGHEHCEHHHEHHHNHSHNHVEEALEILKEAGYKHTNKRQRLVEILNDANRYLSAKQVQELVAPEFPQLSYDTIYRNLYTFVQLNILEEIKNNIDSQLEDISVTNSNISIKLNKLIENNKRAK